MEKEFLPYIPALELKKLGFDEICFGYFLDTNLSAFHGTVVADRRNSKMLEVFNTTENRAITAPTWSAVFRWFREVHNLTWEHQFDDDSIQIFTGDVTYPDNSLEFLKNIEVPYGGYAKAMEGAYLDVVHDLISKLKSKRK
jgi:hypothetical protein